MSMYHTALEILIYFKFVAKIRQTCVRILTK